MLTYEQLKIFARPYTDKRIIYNGKGDGDHIIAADDDDVWWSNHYVIFYGQPPSEKKRPACCERVEIGTPRTSMRLREVCAACTVRAWPVEVRPCPEDDELVMVRFSDGNGATLWANARYVTAMMRRARRRGIEPEFYIDECAGHLALLTHKNGPLAILMPLSVHDMLASEHALGLEPAWRLCNDVPPAKKERYADR